MSFEKLPKQICDSISQRSNNAIAGEATVAPMTAKKQRETTWKWNLVSDESKTDSLQFGTAHQEELRVDVRQEAVARVEHRTAALQYLGTCEGRRARNTKQEATSISTIDWKDSQPDEE